tara:strand:- start:2715 stop:3278 length:564 start_codon:yes stop_codon:yes gene_type:complete
MTANFVNIMSSGTARKLQEKAGSRASYAAMEARANGAADQLTEREAEFIGARDSFYMASVTEDGWPYVQHRGGPKGFLHLMDVGHVGFADYRGNRQYMSAGNFATNDRVALILVDYPARRRLKLIGHAAHIAADDNPAVFNRLMPAGYKAIPESAVVISVTAFDWNCPQHITPRWTAEEFLQFEKDK